MTADWLSQIEAAAELGSRCTAGMGSNECYCEVCRYRLQGHTLDIGPTPFTERS